MSGASLVPYVRTENNKQAGVTPAGSTGQEGADPAPSHSGKAAWCHSPDPPPRGAAGAVLQSPSLALGAAPGRGALCLTTALMERSSLGSGRLRPQCSRGVFPKGSRGRFPVTLGCDTPGAPGRDSPTPSQLCGFHWTQTRGRDVKPTTVMRSEGSRLGILSRPRGSFGTEFRTFACQNVKTQNPKKPNG